MIRARISYEFHDQRCCFVKRLKIVLTTALALINAKTRIASVYFAIISIDGADNCY